MLCLKWIESHNTEIEIIDCQLMDIMETINVINRSILAQKDSKEIFDILQSLLTYTIHHFWTEEQFMMKISFANNWKQFNERETFMKVIQNYLYLISSGKKISMEGLTEFLNKWIELHIATINRCFAEYNDEQMAV